MYIEVGEVRQFVILVAQMFHGQESTNSARSRDRGEILNNMNRPGFYDCSGYWVTASWAGCV
jgi:hypothetical protein